MNRLILIIVLFLAFMKEVVTLDIPGIQLTSDTVVGNILFESSSFFSIVGLLLMVLMLA
jgi:hypothetical protein